MQRAGAPWRWLVVVVASTFVVSACGWTQYRHDAGRSAENPLEQTIGVANVGDLTASWSAPGDGGLYQEALVSSGRVAASTGKQVYLLDEGSGAQLRSFAPMPPTGYNAVLRAEALYRDASDRDVLVVGESDLQPFPGSSTTGVLRAYDATTGGLLWTTPAVGDPFDTALVDGTLFVEVDLHTGSPDDFLGLVALDAATGDVRFRVPVAQGGPSVAATSDTVFVSDGDGFDAVPTQGCGAATCAPVWHGTIGNLAIADLAVANGTVYAGTALGLAAFPAIGCGAATCAPSWTAPGSFGHVAVAGGRVYAAGRLDDAPSASPLSVFDAGGCGAATCQPLWQSTESATFAEPSVANGVVYVGAIDGTTEAWSAAGCGQPTCAALTSIPHPNALVNGPTVVDGRLFAPSTTLDTYTLP